MVSECFQNKTSKNIFSTFQINFPTFILIFRVVKTHFFKIKYSNSENYFKNQVKSIIFVSKFTKNIILKVYDIFFYLSLYVQLISFSTSSPNKIITEKNLFLGVLTFKVKNIFCWSNSINYFISFAT